MPDLTQWTWIVWLALALIFIVIEIFTLEFTFAMLSAGALLGGLGTTLLGGPWWLQILLAAAIAGLLLFLIRPVLLRLLRKSEDRTKHNIDAISEQLGRAETAFVDGRGAVKLDNGETWSAVLPEHEDVDLAPGDRIIVTRVLGATVEVRPRTDERA
ncbi:MAG TPA: NfeD family protein [Microbacteriaceae bacterium]|nr:NfeD family protein [Microbacteriaceae bacterium]